MLIYKLSEVLALIYKLSEVLTFNGNIKLSEV